MAPSSTPRTVRLWTVVSGRDQVVCRLITLDESAGVSQIRVSFNGTPFHSRIFATAVDAGKEAEFLLNDYLGRGWVVSPEIAGETTD